MVPGDCSWVKNETWNFLEGLLFFLLNIFFPGFVVRWLKIDEKVSLGGVSTMGSYIQDISTSIYSDFHSDLFFKGPVHVVFSLGSDIFVGQHHCWHIDLDLGFFFDAEQLYVYVYIYRSWRRNSFQSVGLQLFLFWGGYSDIRIYKVEPGQTQKFWCNSDIPRGPRCWNGNWSLMLSCFLLSALES